MASRRYLTTLLRRNSSLFFSNPQFLHPLKTLTLISHHPSLQLLLPNFDFLARNLSSLKNPKTPNFIDPERERDQLEDDDETSDDEEFDDDDVDDDVSESAISRAYSVEEKIEEAANIGYKVIDPVRPEDRAFKPYEAVFAVIQIGSHQFKVSNGDAIYVEKLKFCEVNDKLILNKVLMVGSPTQTIIGRPILPNAAVHAVVEEHALDAKVIIFKKKRRKNYRRTKGHRQELTRLRITDIQGIEKPETPTTEKTLKASSNKKEEKVAVAA